MLLIKTSSGTLEAVLREAKHALHGKPQNAKAGETILVSQTKNGLLPGQKPIRWIMEYVECYRDALNESDKIWGKHWEFIVKADKVRAVEPFDIDDIKVTDKNYASTQTFSYVDPEDEKAILEWIGEQGEDQTDGRDDALEEFDKGQPLDADALITKLDKKYAGTPKYRTKVVKQIQRPSALRNAIIARDGSDCKLCGSKGFEKKGGGTYAETHHMIELNKQAPDTLQSWNILVVCPTCHKKLHFANLKTEYLNPGWRIFINGTEYLIR